VSNIVDFPNQEKRFDEASLWIARLDRKLTRSEETELGHWLAQDAENGIALMQLAQLWDKMDRLSLLSEIFQAPPRKKSYALRYAMAASFLSACMGVFLLLQFTTENKTPELAYQTAVGEQRKIILDDGSTLILNTDSQVQVIYSTKQRLLLLSRGEIHIDVAHDTSRPLRVVANDKVVQAVGTAFDVRLLNSNKVKLWVTEGRVAIANNKHIANPAALEKEPLKDPNLFISKGEKAILSSSSQQVEKISDGEMSAQLSWQQGNIVFRGETLDEAVLEFNRYSDKTFVIQDTSLKHIRIAGVFKIGDTSSLLSTLRNNFDIRYEQDAGNRILLHINK
jgi:transmembrane sensor